MKNKIEDLRNHLFAQLERLSDEDLSGEDLKKEVARAKAICDVSNHIVQAADLELKFILEVQNTDSAFFPKQIGDGPAKH